MRSLEDIIVRAKRLSVRDRRRLLNALTPGARHAQRGSKHKAARPADHPYGSLLRLAGTAHVDATDIASDKYRYYAAAAQDISVAGERAGKPTLRLVVSEGPTAGRTADDDEPVAEVRGINVHAKQRVEGRERDQIRGFAATSPVHLFPRSA